MDNRPMQTRKGNPCKDCPDRRTACSDKCQKPKYLKWRTEQELIRKNRQKYNATIDYVQRQIVRNRRK